MSSVSTVASTKENPIGVRQGGTVGQKLHDQRNTAASSSSGGNKAGELSPARDKHADSSARKTHVSSADRHKRDDHREHKDKHKDHHYEKDKDRYRDYYSKYYDDRARPVSQVNKRIGAGEQDVSKPTPPPSANLSTSNVSGSTQTSPPLVKNSTQDPPRNTSTRGEIKPTKEALELPSGPRSIFDGFSRSLPKSSSTYSYFSSYCPTATSTTDDKPREQVDTVFGRCSKGVSTGSLVAGGGDSVMSKDSTTRLSKLPTSASGAIPKTYAQYLSSKEQASKAEERPGLTKSAFIYVDSSKNPQQPERVRYVYTNDPSALAGQSDFQFVYAENTEVPKVSSTNLFSEKVVKPGPPATSSSNFPSTSPAHSSAETIKDRTLDAKAKFLATPGASVVEAKYSVTSPLETTRAFPSTSSGPYRPDRTSYLPNYTQRIDRLPYYTTSSGLRPVETKAPTAAVDYVNAEAFDSPSSSSSSYTATVHLVGKTPGVPTALPQTPVVSSALSRSPPAPIIHPRTPGTSVTLKTASVPTPAVTPLSPVTPAETAPMSTLGAQAREERLATVSTVGEQLAQLSSANVAQTEVASSVIENKTVSQGSKKKSSSRERTQTPDDDRPGSPEFRSGVTRSGSNTPCGTLRVYRVVELADGVQHTPIQVLGSKGHRQSLGRKSHEYAVDDDEGHGHMPDVVSEV